MSLWSEANKRLHAKGLRSYWRVTPANFLDNYRSGMRQGTDRVVTRTVTNKDGTTEKRRAIVPKDRSKYNADGSLR